MKDLIERLRHRAATYSWDSTTFYTSDARMMGQAAAALTTQAARIAELEALLRIEREHRGGPAF